MKKKVHKNYNQFWLFVIALFFVILIFIVSLKEDDVQEFTNLVIDGASNENATLEDGISFAEKYSPRLITTRAISINNIVSTVTNTAEDLSSSVKDKAIDVSDFTQDTIGNLLDKTKLKITVMQEHKTGKKFKILIIGNGMSHSSLVDRCKKIINKFSTLYPYSTIKDQFTISCASLPLDIRDVNSNPASKALALTMAKIEKQKLGYDIAIVLEKGQCRSFALPTFATLVCNEGDNTPKLFMHELTHSFAGACDEYSSPDDIKEINSILTKLSMSKIHDQMDLFKMFNLRAPPNCIKKIKSTCDPWFEGGALVSSGVCRASYNSMMKDYNYEQFNQPTIDRILAVAQGR